MTTRLLRALAAAFLTAAATIVAGCGGTTTTTKTVTVTQVRTVTVTSPAEAPSGSSTAPPATATADSSGPDGTVALDGTYEVQVAESRGGNAGGDPPQEPVAWRMATTCTAQGCTLSIHRQLAKGGYKDLELEQDPDRPDQYVGESFGATECGGTTRDSRLTLRIRALNPDDAVTGRLTARSVEAYLRSPVPCGTQPRSLAIYRGRRQAG